MLAGDSIVVQASIQPRTTFFATAMAGLKTGDTVVIAPPSGSNGPEAILALIEAVSYEFADRKHLGVTRGVLTILAALRNGKIDGGSTSCPMTFVGTLTSAAPELRASYYGEVDLVRDPVTGDSFAPAALEVGALLGESTVNVVFNSAGFNRHTVMLAQSGAGKSYALGVVLEELVANTKLRIIVADPNGDFAGLAAIGVSVASSRDPGVYAGAIRTAVSNDGGTLVLDLNALDQLLWPKLIADLAESLWETRDGRRPTLLVIDEAHNFASSVAGVGVDVTKETLVRIAAEGRKFGLCLLLATQRPQKLDANIISQCDNLILLKLSNNFDIEHVAGSFGAVARNMVDLAIGFPVGAAFAAGRIVKSPTLLRFRKRKTAEGGGDLSLAWCRPTCRLSPPPVRSCP